MFYSTSIHILWEIDMSKYYTETKIVVKDYDVELIKFEINEFITNGLEDKELRCYSVYHTQRLLYESLIVCLEYYIPEAGFWCEFDEDYGNEVLDAFLQEYSKLIGVNINVRSSYYPENK
jgi:hypothetical protein